MTENKTTSSTTTHSHSEEVSIGDEVTVGVTFTASGLERYAVEGYYDRAFGTMAFKSVPQKPTALISGLVLDKDGLPVARQIITLKIRNKTFMTRTDDQGRYAFHSATIPPGRGMLMLDSRVRKELRFSGTPLKNQELRLQR